MVFSASDFDGHTNPVDSESNIETTINHVEQGFRLSVEQQRIQGLPMGQTKQ